MKHCILTGGGSKFGAILTEKFLDQGYIVHLITSSPSKWKNVPYVNTINVDWHRLDISKLKSLIPNIDHVDVIFFNHNASALSAERFNTTSLQNPRDWGHSYFVATQFPYYYIKILSKKINTETKIGWMLSELINQPNVNQVGFADYIGNKFTNACIMKSFSMTNSGCFFGLHPDGGTGTDPNTKAIHLVNIIDTYSHTSLNGNIFDSHGNSLNIF